MGNADRQAGRRMSEQRLRVGIFAGGRSAEHEVSVASAEAVLRAIDRDRFEPFLVYIDRDGRWLLPNGAAPELGSQSLAGILGAMTPAEEVVYLRSHDDPQLPATTERHGVAPRVAVRSLADAIDVAFLVVHGPFGEDGTLQGFLELAGIPYVGAGVLASAIAMDKVVFKDLMRGHGLPVVESTWFRRGTWEREPAHVAREVAERIGPRSVVKPARLGSSVGMTLVHDLDELPAALAEAFRYDSKVIVERYVEGARELECGVLGNDDPIVFEPGEMRSEHEFYDYEAKYVDGLASVEPRANVDADLAARLKELSLTAYRAVDCAGLARIDFLVTAEEVQYLRSPEDPQLPAASERDGVAPKLAVGSLADAIDVAFLVVHGPFGEDGTLQGFLELAGIPYVGAGVLASAVAMDKVVFKDLMRGHGLPVVESTWFRRGTWDREPEHVAREVAEKIGPRSVVKPARLGSSVGMTLVHDLEELPNALTEAFRYDSKVIVERYVEGARELECGVLGNDDPIVFEPGEVRSQHEFYDYESKYVDGLASVEPRANVDADLAARLKELSLTAYRAVDCAGLARVDFLVTAEEVYISEMNTLPGFTATSMYPKQAELAGLGFDALIARLIELALERDR